MAELKVRVVKGGSSHATLSGLTDLRTNAKVNDAQSVTGTLFQVGDDGVEAAVAGATALPFTRVATDPAGQYRAAIPATATSPLDVGRQLHMVAEVVMPDARRMPFDAWGSVFPSGPSST